MDTTDNCSGPVRPVLIARYDGQNLNTGENGVVETLCDTHAQRVMHVLNGHFWYSWSAYKADCKEQEEYYASAQYQRDVLVDAL